LLLLGLAKPAVAARWSGALLAVRRACSALLLLLADAPAAAAVQPRCLLVWRRQDLVRASPTTNGGGALGWPVWWSPQYRAVLFPVKQRRIHLLAGVV